jgi:hypothetical protein
VKTAKFDFVQQEIEKYLPKIPVENVKQANQLKSQRSSVHSGNSICCQGIPLHPKKIQKKNC